MNDGMDYKNVSLLNNIDNKIIDLKTDFNELKSLLKDCLIIDDDYYSSSELENVIEDIDKLEKNIKELSISCTNSGV